MHALEVQPKHGECCILLRLRVGWDRWCMVAFCYAATEMLCPAELSRRHGLAAAAHFGSAIQAIPAECTGGDAEKLHRFLNVRNNSTRYSHTKPSSSTWLAVFRHSSGQIHLPPSGKLHRTVALGFCESTTSTLKPVQIASIVFNYDEYSPSFQLRLGGTRLDDKLNQAWEQSRSLPVSTWETATSARRTTTGCATRLPRVYLRQCSRRSATSAIRQHTLVAETTANLQARRNSQMPCFLLLDQHCF